PNSSTAIRVSIDLALLSVSDYGIQKHPNLPRDVRRGATSSSRFDARDLPHSPLLLRPRQLARSFPRQPLAVAVFTDEAVVVYDLPAPAKRHLRKAGERPTLVGTPVGAAFHLRVID